MGHRGYGQKTHAGAPSNRELRRRAMKIIKADQTRSQQMAELWRERAHARLMLITVLMQLAGGQATITKGTLEQVQAKFGQLGYGVEPRKDADGKPSETEFVISVIETPAEAEGEPAADEAATPEDGGVASGEGTDEDVDRMLSEGGMPVNHPVRGVVTQALEGGSE